MHDESIATPALLHVEFCGPFLIKLKYPRVSISTERSEPVRLPQKAGLKSHAGRFPPNRAANSIVPGLGLGTYGK